jgi:alpha-glucosidase
VVDGRWESVLVEDDGLTVPRDEAAGAPERLTTTVVVERTDGRVSVEHATAGPGYAGHARTRFDVVHHTAA